MPKGISVNSVLVFNTLLMETVKMVEESYSVTIYWVTFAGGVQLTRILWFPKEVATTSLGGDVGTKRGRRNLQHEESNEDKRTTLDG